MADIAIQIEPRYPKPHRANTGNTAMRYRVLYNGEELGIWHAPAGSAARKLLELGYAQRCDVLHTYRGSTPCLVGDIGWFADHAIRESDAYNGGVPIFVKWRPLPDFVGYQD